MAGDVFREYWQLRVAAAAAQLEAARKIISHGTTRGTIAENTVRGIVAPLLPTRYGIASGFLLSKEAAASRQVDVLVFDRSESSPIYEDPACAVVSPDMAVLAVEVKSTLNRKDLRDAVENVASVKRLNPEVLAILFAFTGFNADTLATHLPAVVSPLAPAHRIDVMINLGQDYAAELDQTTRASYNCRKGPGVAVDTLLLQTVGGARVRNLLAYLDAEPGPGEGSVRVEV